METEFIKIKDIRQRLSKTNFYTEIIIHFKNYLSAHVATNALALISVPILTRLLIPEDYGTYNVFMSYYAMCAVVLTLNCDSSVGRYFYERQDDFSTFLGTTITVNLMVLSLSSLLFFILRHTISTRLNLPEVLVLILPVLVILGLIDSLYSQIYQALRESKKLAITSVVRAYIGFVFGVGFVFLYTHNRYMGLIIAQIAVGIPISIYLIIQIKPYFTWGFEKKHVKYILTYSIPLIPYTLSGLILAQFDRIMINSYKGSSDAGLYSLAYNIGMLLSIFSGAIYAAWMPKYFELMNRKDYLEIDRTVDKMFRLIILAAGFLILFGQEIGMLLAARQYHSSLHIVPVIVLSYVFYSIFPIYAWSIGYAYKTYWSSAIVLLSGVINIALNAVYIPKYGYVAAAYTTLASYLLMAILTWICNRFILKLHAVPFAILSKPSGILLVMYGIFLILPFFIQGIILLLLFKVVLMLIMAYTLMRKFMSILVS